MHCQGVVYAMGVTEDRARNLFLERVARDADGCWLWAGHIGRDGYGVCRRGSIQGAHLVSFYYVRGRKPVGILRNECGHRDCVNPDHWREAVKGPGVFERRAEEIGRLWGAGVSVADICASVGVSRTTVWRYVRKLKDCE